MEFDWSHGELAEGLRCYRNREFWFAHEHWEAVWLKCEQPDKTFLQALIQVTAAFHHLQRGNLIGLASLLRAALRRLENFPTTYGGVNVAALREEICLWLRSLDHPGSSPQPSFPRIF
jgi:predicted metal-dependent hydrolase